MKIKSVELMRNIRDRISQETIGMSWLEQQEYLRSHITHFELLLKEMPNKAVQPAPRTLRVSGRTDG